LSEPADHLLRSATIAEGQRRLSELTGMSRLELQTSHLSAGERLLLPAGSERFLYMVAGAGFIEGADFEKQPVSAGDFIALEAHEEAALETRDSLTALSGRLSSN
jgi:hypothetical protein